MHLPIFALTWALLPRALARCYEPSPAFPLPSLSPRSEFLEKLFTSIGDSLKHAVADDSFSTSSFSVEVTSSKETLWSSHHTANDRNESRPGTHIVNGDSVYRIASITKTFTTLGVLQQHAAGNLSLDDPINKYIPELDGHDGSIPWKDITLRTLASQLSGIPREFAQSDLQNEVDDPTRFGLPPASRKGLPKCDEYKNYRPCNRKEFLDTIKAKSPVFAPNQKSTYSNVAFLLLGLAIENVTGLSYTEYISHTILDRLEMSSSSLEKPDDAVAVLPKGDNYWDIEEGIQRPTGGLYSSSTDLSRYLRYILTHYNAITPALSWLHPASYSTGLYSFFGMPWEIFRTSKLLSNNQRPVTFVTKSGGVPGYVSIIIVAPDYDLGITILVAGNGRLLLKLQELVTVPLIRGVEHMAYLQMNERYPGTYVPTSSSLNSTLTLAADPVFGLTITQFISNGTDVLTALSVFADPDTVTRPWHAQLVPTLLYSNQTKQNGERWRMLIVPDRPDKEEFGVWDDFCITDVDQGTYAGVALNEIVFWSDDRGEIVEVEVPAFRVTLQQESQQQLSNAAGNETQNEILMVQ